MLGIQGKQYISPKLTIPTSRCIHPSTHNQETFGNRVPQPSKSIRYMSYGNTPELPSTGWRRGYLTNNCIKDIFDVGKTQVFQNCNDKIMTATPRSSTPQTLPQPLNVRRHQEQCSRHKNIKTIPRYPCDPKKISEIWGEDDKTSTSGVLTRATKGLGSKKNS